MIECQMAVSSIGVMRRLERSVDRRLRLESRNGGTSSCCDIVQTDIDEQSSTGQHSVRHSLVHTPALVDVLVRWPVASVTFCICLSVCRCSKAGIPRDQHRHRHRHGHPRWIVTTCPTCDLFLARILTRMSVRDACVYTCKRVLYTISYHVHVYKIIR